MAFLRTVEPQESAEKGYFLCRATKVGGAMGYTIPSHLVAVLVVFKVVKGTQSCLVNQL